MDNMGVVRNEGKLKRKGKGWGGKREGQFCPFTYIQKGV